MLLTARSRAHLFDATGHVSLCCWASRVVSLPPRNSPKTARPRRTRSCFPSSKNLQGCVFVFFEFICAAREAESCTYKGRHSRILSTLSQPASAFLNSASCKGLLEKKKKLKRILICYGDTLSAAAAFALVRSAWFEESVPLTDCSCHSRASSVVLVRWGRPALRFLIGRFIARTRRGSCCLRLLACVEVCSEARRADAPTTRALARGDARARGRRGFHGVCRRCRRVALRS